MGGSFTPFVISADGTCNIQQASKSPATSNRRSTTSSKVPVHCWWLLAAPAPAAIAAARKVEMLRLKGEGLAVAYCWLLVLLWWS
jgi:hypothetical protein